MAVSQRSWNLGAGGGTAALLLPAGKEGTSSCVAKVLYLSVLLFSLWSRCSLPLFLRLASVSSSLPRTVAVPPCSHCGSPFDEHCSRLFRWRLSLDSEEDQLRVIVYSQVVVRFACASRSSSSLDGTSTCVSAGW
jgi:hypothetical protein